MKKITLETLRIENFKGIKELTTTLGEKTTISGKNASGKTTILDAFMWLLFGKDSQGKADFQIRPIDTDGNMVNNVEIMVEATLTEDSALYVHPKTITLTKTQKQKWTKKRGSTSPTFSGNENAYKVDGFPATQKEYDAKVFSLVDEKVFRLITDPRAFPAMKWQDQRAILLLLVPEITDEDILNAFPDEYALVADDIKVVGAEKAKEKEAATLRDLKKEQATFPVRIDEAMKSVTEVNTFGIDAEKAEAEKRLEEIRKNREDLQSSLTAMHSVQDEIMRLRMEISSIEQKAQEEVRNSRYVSQKAYDDAVMGVRSLTDQYNRTADTLDQAKKTLEYYKNDIKTEAETFKAIRRRVLSEDETTCPTCGRLFDAEKVDEIKRTFNERKQKDLEASNARGTALRGSIKVTEDKIAFLTETMASLKVQISDQTQKMDALKTVLESAPTEANMDGNSAYQEAVFRLSQLQSRLSTMDNGESRRMAIDAAERDAMADLRDIDERLAVVQANQRANERVQALQAEQLECGQKVADQEQRLFLLDEFSKQKMDMLSDKINSNFKSVRFKLFDTLINGAVTPTCVMQVASNGSWVDYPNVNHAAQILGGMDVIDALSDLYGVSAPIWIDNAEALDSNNVPETKSQLIMLNVSDNPMLMVERR